MKEQQAAARFGAISQETRLRIVRHLVKAGPNGSSAGEIANQVGVSASALSFHVSTLAQAGLITSQRDSRRIIYTVDFNAIGELLTFLLDDCCQCDPALLTHCGITVEKPCC